MPEHDRVERAPRRHEGEWQDHDHAGHEGAAEEEIFRAEGATTKSGTATSSAYCWESIAKAQRIPASSHRSRRTQAMANNATPRARTSCGWKNDCTAIHTGRRLATTSSVAGSHKRRPRPHVRNHAITPAMSASQVTQPIQSVGVSAPERELQWSMAVAMPLPHPGPRLAADGNGTLWPIWVIAAMPPATRG